MTALILILLGSGVAFSLLAAVGIFRMPDVYTRMQASSKAGTLGCALVLGAVALAYDDPGVTARAILVIAFVLLTGPVAAHVVSRAAYRTGTPPAPETMLDELRDEPRPPAAEEHRVDRPDDAAGR
jgi:multicomponent Na+:H+ antiporter subunit G